MSLNKVARVGTTGDRNSSFTVTTSINGHRIVMDLDTCAEVSIAPSFLYKQLGRPRLKPAPRLRTYGGTPITTLGQSRVTGVRGSAKTTPARYSQRVFAVATIWHSFNQRIPCCQCAQFKRVSGSTRNAAERVRGRFQLHDSTHTRSHGAPLLQGRCPILTQGLTRTVRLSSDG